MTDTSYLELVYAGIIGKVAGVRLGAPVEPTIWSYDRIRACYGDITGYLREFTNFAADDDLNGPLFFIRALSDYREPGQEIEPEDVGRAWLDYARDGKGMFWWGGYGRSAEHTAYLHLKAGVMPPLSGSMQLSGPIMPQQIGGQIFIDSWGLIAPGDPAQAARLAGTAATVAHDGVGIDGARFVAAAIAAAFAEQDMEKIVERAMAEVRPESDLHRIYHSILAFRADHPDDFRACRDFLDTSFGYRKYPGVCPLPTNAGVIILALLYGSGDFGRTIEIATMCGWDTDCNAGNAGTIAGVAYGLSAIPPRYRGPINDLIIASSVAGSLNIVDIPAAAAFIAGHRYQIADTPVPEPVSRLLPGRDLSFAFDLPGSTHGFRLSESLHFQLRHDHETGADSGPGCLEILVDRLERGQQGTVFYKPWYRRTDFDDERYDPAFSPQVYCGQAISFRTSVSIMSGETIRLAPFVRTDEQLYEGVFQEFGPGHEGIWTDHRFVVPETGGVPVSEIGMLVMNYSKAKFLGHVRLDDVTVSGPGSFAVDFARQTIEFGTITQCTTTNGAWSLEDGWARCSSDGPAYLFTGNYYSSDYRVTGVVQPEYGESHLLIFRALGTRRMFAFGLSGTGAVRLVRHNHGREILAEAPFAWEYGRQYHLTVRATGRKLVCRVNGDELIRFEDESDLPPHGMVGYGHDSLGHTLFGTIEVAETGEDSR
jgi:ADP-ribosylglycohydrolase